MWRGPRPRAGGTGTPDWDLVDQADTVIVPACTSIHGAAPAPLLQALQRADQRGARIASICSGAFVLAEAGLLRGRRAATHWMHADELAHRYPETTVDARVLYVEDHVWTSAGTTAGIDMSLKLVRRDHGAAVANAVAPAMVTPPHPTATGTRPSTANSRPHPNRPVRATCRTGRGSTFTS